MYFPKIKKTTAELELMISALEMQYGTQIDKELSILMAKYFDIDAKDAESSLMAYRGYKEEDYEQLSIKQQEYAKL